MTTGKLEFLYEAFDGIVFTEVADSDLTESMQQSAARNEQLEGAPSMFLKGQIGFCDKSTANDRLYRRKILESAANKLINRPGKALGESDHPDKGAAPSVNRVSHLIHEISFGEAGEDGSCPVYGVFEVIGTDRGKNVMEIARKGGRLGASLRGRGSSVVNDKGIHVIAENMILDSWDIVVNPAAFGGSWLSVVEPSRVGARIRESAGSEGTDAVLTEGENAPEVTLADLMSQHPAIFKAYEAELAGQFSESLNSMSREHQQEIRRIKRAYTVERDSVLGDLTLNLCEAVVDCANAEEAGVNVDEIVEGVANRILATQQTSLAEAVGEIKTITETSQQSGGSFEFDFAQVSENAMAARDVELIAEALGLEGLPTAGELVEAIQAFNNESALVDEAVDAAREAHRIEKAEIVERIKALKERHAAEIAALREENEETREALKQALETICGESFSEREEEANNSADLTESEPETLEEDEAVDEPQKNNLKNYLESRGLGLKSNEIQEVVSHINSGHLDSESAISDFIEQRFEASPTAAPIIRRSKANSHIDRLTESESPKTRARKIPNPHRDFLSGRRS